jgi:hypothetical protein
MRQTSSSLPIIVSQEIETRVRGRIYTDEEVDEYIIILEKLLPLSIGELEVDDLMMSTNAYSGQNFLTFLEFKKNNTLAAIVVFLV